MKRADSQCELCKSTESLKVYHVEPSEGRADQAVLACPTCVEQMDHPDKVDANHWRCLSDTMWSQEPPVQVMAWRMLTRLKSEGWPIDLIDQMYMADETMIYAQATGEGEEGGGAPKHVDSNGLPLESGDTVILVQSLDVKGANFTAKRGTSVRRIRLVEDNHEHIEGKVNGQNIVILTKFVKKAK